MAGRRRGRAMPGVWERQQRATDATPHPAASTDPTTVEMTGLSTVLADPTTEAAFRASARPVERATLRIGVAIVAAVDVGIHVTDAVFGDRPITAVEAFVRAGTMLVCIALWALLRRDRPAHWKGRATAIGLTLIGLVAAVIFSGHDMTFGAGLLIPAGVLVIFLAVRLDLKTLVLFAITYSMATFLAWLSISPDVGRQQIPILITIVALAHIVGFAECRRLQRERRAVFVHQRTLTTISTTDDLTGLANRRQFYHVGDTVLAHADRHGLPAAALLIDLNRFKEINDTLGHHAGDVLLTEVAARLRRSLPDAAMVARLGGDEFAALLTAPAVAPDGWAIEAARRFLAALDAPVELDGLTLHIHASVGVAVRTAGQDRADLVRQADVAMYQAKQVGDGVGTYSPDRDNFTRRTVELASGLDGALRSDEIRLYYQPKTDIADGVTRTVEALIRWQHPTRGLLTPDQFLPIAETHGMMRTLTLRVIELALAQACAWRAAGRNIRIAVNLAPANLLDARFPIDVADLLAASQVPASALQLEITEDTIMVDPDRILATITALGAMGFTFALDDYGTGYSSLSYLSILPIDELKIDRTFITGLPANPNHQVIVRSTIEMARQLGFTVVAEGVEDIETWQSLALMGCQAGQGYYLSKPIPADEFAGWLDARRSPCIDTS